MQLYFNVCMGLCDSVIIIRIAADVEGEFNPFIPCCIPEENNQITTLKLLFTLWGNPLLVPNKLVWLSGLISVALQLSLNYLQFLFFMERELRVTLHVPFLSFLYLFKFSCYKIVHT